MNESNRDTRQRSLGKLNWLPLIMLLGWSCTPAATHVVVNNNVQVTVTDGPQAGQSPPAIRMDDKRIAVAFDALAKLLGHPIQFEIDNSLLPKFDEQLHEAFIEALETLVTSLEYAKRYYPDAMAYGSAHLRTLRWTYSPSKVEVETELDVQQDRLEVPVAADASRLLQDALITSVLDRAWDKEKERRYTKLEPEAVPSAEHAHYLDFQTSYRRPLAGETKVEKEQREIATLQTILRLFPRITNPEVKAKAHRFLSNAGRDVRGWLTKAQETTALRGPARQIHASWIQWVNGAFPTFSDVERREMANLLFTHSYEPAPEFGAGLDVTAIARPRIRSWLERSRQQNRNSYDSDDGANALIVCPYDYDETYERFSVPSQCNGLLYTTLSHGGTNMKPLVTLIEAENALPFTQTATLNILNHLGGESAVELVEALLHNEAHAKAALVALAEFAGWGARANRRSELPKLSPSPFIRKIPAWWASRPGLHAELLYLVVKLGDEYEGSVVWPKLAQYLGARLTGPEVAGFLRQGPSTIWHLRSLVRAVSDDWSRSKVLIPELERFLNHANESGRGEPSPYYVTERCMEFLCITGTHQDVSALQAFLRDRVERYPSEKRNLDSFIEASPARLCPLAKAAVEQSEKKAQRDVTFGD